MQLYEILLIGAALSMDAFAVGMTNAMTEPRMRPVKGAAIALTFGFFQFAMPLLGYFCGSVFSSVVGMIAPYLSFLLLAVIGGNATLESLKEMKNNPCGRRLVAKKKLGAGKLVAQGLATSMDALAVGVTLLAEDVTRGLPVSVLFCSLLIGGTTLLLTLVAVGLGKFAGGRLADRAGLAGGFVLIVIGAKILLEGVL